MKPEIIVFSRTPQEDYRYLYPLPSCAAPQTQEFVRTQLRAMQDGQVDGIVHFFVSDTDAVLLRRVDSGSADVYGRTIYSMEGLYCPEREVREFWLCLSAIVPGFWKSPSLQSIVTEGERIAEIPVSELLNAYLKQSRKSLQTPAFAKIINQAEQPVSFSFGEGGLCASDSIKTAQRWRWLPRENRKYRLRVVFDEKRKSACIEAVSAGTPIYPLVRSEVFSREKTGWAVDILKRAAHGAAETAEQIGWREEEAR